MSSQTKSVIIVMMKAPYPGEVKTRLSPPLNAVDAAGLAACFAQDTVNKASLLSDEVHITYTPESARIMLQELLHPNLVWFLQQGDDLGARMQTAIQTSYRSLLCPAILCGTDCPTFPSHLITEAINSLTSSSADIVLGPTDDGGFHLIGVREPVPLLFEDVVWSTDTVLEKVLRNAAILGQRAQLLPRWYDVDTENDFFRLQIEMRMSKTARESAPKTAAWLKEYEDKHHHSDSE